MGFFLSICCWPLSETGGWACWTCALIWYKCYFLKNFENPLPLKQRRGKRGVLHDWTAVMRPTWAKEEDCNFHAKSWCCLPRTDGCTSFLSATHTYPCYLFRQASLANVFFLYHAHVSKNICGSERLINHTHTLNKNWKLWREVDPEVRNGPPLRQNVCSYL